jgi:hypothetical protein
MQQPSTHQRSKRAHTRCPSLGAHPFLCTLASILAVLASSRSRCSRSICAGVSRSLNRSCSCSAPSTALEVGLRSRPDARRATAFLNSFISISRACDPGSAPSTYSSGSRYRFASTAAWWLSAVALRTPTAVVAQIGRSSSPYSACSDGAAKAVVLILCT